MITFHTDTVDVLTAAPAGTDRYGNPVLDWDNAAVTTVGGCRVQPVPGTELLDRLTRRWVLFAPADTVLVSANRIRWGGDVYDVVGEVRRWPSPSGALAHIEADLARVEG
jgi:hypothetical protein